MPTAFQQYNYNVDPTQAGGTAPYMNTPETAFTSAGGTVAATRPTSNSGGNSFLAMLNGDTLNGVANLVSSFTGKGNTSTTVVTPTPSGSDNTWLILGGVAVLALVVYFFTKKS